MRKLVLEEWLSLDGFAEDRNGTLDFFKSMGDNRAADEDALKFLDRVDAILMGRRTYELFVKFWPTATTDTEIIADKLNALPKFVFSNSLEAAPWGKWAPAQIIRDGAPAEIRRLREEQGKDMVMWGSLSLAQHLMAMELIDEYRCHFCPTLLGGGRRLFPDRESSIELVRVDVKTYDGGVVFAQYARRQAT